MTTCAVIRNGVVINFIMASPRDPVPPGDLLVANPPQYVEIGMQWDGTNFVPPVGTLPPDIDGLDTV